MCSKLVKPSQYLVCGLLNDQYSWINWSQFACPKSVIAFAALCILPRAGDAFDLVNEDTHQSLLILGQTADLIKHLTDESATLSEPSTVQRVATDLD